MQAAIPATIIQQWIAARIETNPLNLTNDDLVVAPCIHGVTPAFDIAKRIAQDRDACFRRVPVDLRKPIFIGTSEKV